MKILVVVDMQKDFIDGALGTKEAQAIVPNVKKKIEDAVANEAVVIYTRDTHFEDYLNTNEGKKLPVEHCIKDTEGWQIPNELLEITAEYEKSIIADKLTFGLYSLPKFLNDVYTKDLDENETIEIELVGLCTDICVVSNALLLKSWYFENAEISVDANCCAGVTPETHEAALKTMEMCQINVKR